MSYANPGVNLIKNEQDIRGDRAWPMCGAPDRNKPSEFKSLSC